TGADSWGSVINIGQAGVVDYMFNMFDDDVLCGYDGNTATDGDPDGFIKIIIGGQDAYIWTYTNKS
ncbi:MAG: hypothetical protein IMF19_04090, partial [Proteobacteria bacterium]|nr:hypothetical protein [Pseudomonadota bacterium]